MKAQGLRWLLWGWLLFDVVLFYVFADQPRGVFHLWVLPRGQGFLLVAPTAHAVLVDGGKDDRALSTWVGAHMAPFTGRLDMVLLLTSDASVTTAQVKVFHHYPPSRAMHTPWVGNPASSVAWEQHARRTYTLAVGDTWTWEGVNVNVWALSPPVIRFHLGTWHWLYMPEGCPTGGLPPAQMWVLGAWEGCAGQPLPQWVVGKPMPLGEKEAYAVLGAPTTTFRLGDEVHLLTDGRHYAWEAPARIASAMR